MAVDRRLVALLVRVLRTSEKDNDFNGKHGDSPWDFDDFVWGSLFF